MRRQEDGASKPRDAGAKSASQRMWDSEPEQSDPDSTEKVMTADKLSSFSESHPSCREIHDLRNIQTLNNDLESNAMISRAIFIPRM